ncbi:hypothetical protein [Roseateles sp.]|uniref:hypothetical protein n=1 Tax=Roseateles sp. TaxID=1971397 RepID=UPI003BAAC22A
MYDERWTTGTVAVVISANELPRFYSIQEDLHSELLLNGEAFTDSGSGDWLGFYDWLRTKSDEVIGVRIWVDKPNRHLSNAARCLNVASAKNNFPFVIYFSSDREFEDIKSCDQEFGSNMLFLSSEKFAFTFSSPRTS